MPHFFDSAKASDTSPLRGMPDDAFPLIQQGLPSNWGDFGAQYCACISA